MTKRFKKKKNYLILRAYNFLSFISFVSFISRFVDDYKVDSGEIGNSSTENAQFATTSEHIQLERYLSARRYILLF